VRKTYSANDSALRARLLAELGSLQRSAGQFGESVDSFRKAMALNKEDAVQYYLNIIDSYRSAHDAAAANKEIDAAVADIKKAAGTKADFQTYSDLASIYEKGKRWVDMGRVLDEAAKLAGSAEQKQQVAFTRGAMLERQKKIDASET
jgi:tetratricopeptide (TPR) repeat protein